MDFCETVARQRAYFEGGNTRPLDWRRSRLEILGRILVEAESDLLAALRADLGKSPLEAYTSEIGFVLADIDYAVRHLSRWMRPRRYPVPPIAWPASARVDPEPLGVALIIGPWNYPVQLLLSPLVGALAAGNCVCLKPSEYAPRTAETLASHMARRFPPEEVTTVCGGADTAAALLQERYDKIFFTGSGAVARLVMRAAADHLTPVTLELGGKSPCLVFADARIDQAARRILWGKCLNAGQTCVSPDYVLVDRSVHAPFLAADDVVLNADFGYAMTHLFDPGVLRKYAPPRLERRKFSCSTYMLYLGVDRVYDLPHHVIFFADDYRANVDAIFRGRATGSNFSVYVRNATVTDPTLAPEGHSALYVLVPVANLRGETDWRKDGPAFRQTVLDVLERRAGLKGLAGHIVQERVVTPMDWQDAYRVYAGATFNLAHNLGQMIYLRPRNKFEEVDHCYLVGGGTHPGSGLPTIYESGRIAANLLCENYGIAFTPPSLKPC